MNLISVIKNRSQLSPIMKINFIPSYQGSRYIVLAPPSSHCYLFCPNLHLLYPNNWPTLVYRLSKSSHLSPVSILNAPKANTNPGMSSAPFCLSFHFLLTNFKPTMHPNYLLSFCLLWIHSISLRPFSSTFTSSFNKNYTQPWQKSRLLNPCVEKKNPYQKKKKRQTTPWQS